MMNTRLVFHHVIGQSIKLSEDRLSACRKNPIEEYDNAWVFSERCITENEEFQIQILHLISSHNQSLQFGITVENPEDLKQAGLLSQNEIFKNSWMLQNDKVYYQNDDNIITIEEYNINLSLLQEGDLIGLKINEKRELCFTHNGITYPSAAEDIPQNVWVFVNLYGRCSFITLIPPKSPITRSQKDKMIKKLKLLKENDRKHDEYEICFHSYCGKEVYLSENNRVAQRKNPTNEFRNAVIISNRPLITNKSFKLRIEGLVNKWNGSIEFGVTIHNPDSFELPATMTNLRSGTLVLSGNSILTNGHGNQLPYSSTGLDDLKIGDEIGVMRNSNGDINFFINEKDLGVAGNISIETEIWVIIDLYGRTIKVTIPSSQPKLALLNLENDLISYSEEFDDKLAFHPICGRNVLITQDGYSASRINDHEFNNGVVFTNRPIQIGERWTVKLIRCVEQWAGNLEMGITTLIPNELDIPSTMTDLNIGYTAMLTTNGLVINGCPLSQSAQSLNLENVHSVLLSGISSLIEDSTLGVELIARDKLQFFINNADLGIITLQTDKDIYGVVDLYGKAAEVSIYLKETFNRSLQIKNTSQSLSVHNNDHIGNEIGDSCENPLYSDDNSDCDRQFDHHHPSDHTLNKVIPEVDRSSSRLPTTDDVISEELRSPVRTVLRFHDIHGRNVFLSNEGRTAYRPSPNNEFKNALVMSSRPLSTNELFEICVEKMTDHWSGSLEMGVTLIRPEELNFPGTLSQLDKDCWILSGSCLMNNGITARNDYGLDMDGIHVNSKIGLVRRQNGMLHFLLDGVDMSSAYFDVPTGIYVILDLYGQCSQVSITSRSGISLSSEHAIVNVNPIRQLFNSLSTRDHQESIYNMDNEFNFQSSQNISAFKITMSAIKKNLSNTSGILCHSKPTKFTFKDKPVIDDLNSSSNFSEKNFRINSFFCETICGPGVTSDGLGHFHTEDQNQNCIIHFKQSLKTDLYYELLFLNNKKNDYNLETISFGTTCDKISADNYLPSDLTLVKSPSWIINEGALFINSVLRCQTFALGLNLFKNKISVGIYFYDNSNVEIFIDHVSVGKVISDIHKKCYLMINLHGWYNTLIGMRISPKPNNSLSQRRTNLNAPNYLYKNQIGTENSGNEMFHEQHLLDFDENLDIEDPFIVTIVNELSQLLPQFFVIMHGIDTLKLTEKIININNDIVLCVRKRLMTKHLIKRFTNGTIFKIEIQNQLIEELSNRFSHLSELKNLGNSKYEIARILRRRILSHQIEYDDRKVAFILPNSFLYLEESQITRYKSGCDFGLCILNHELKSQKFSSYEIQISPNESINETGFKSHPMSPILGLILLQSSHFPNIEDAFRFLMNIPCTKRLNLLWSNINEYLELLNFEAKCAVLAIEEDCVYFNDKKICRNMPFNVKNVSVEDYLSFVTIDSECEIEDIYLSVRKMDSAINYKVFSEAWLEQNCIIKSIYSTRNIYYYVPFVWLANQSVITVTTDAKKKIASGTDIPNTNQPDWLEKHYHDGLNKESTQLEISDSLIMNNMNKQDQQCISTLKSIVIKKALALPDVYFHNKLVECYCKSCYYPINVNNAEQIKEFRLPHGWVKYNIRIGKDDKSISSLWKLAYLTVPSGLLHRLLASSNPNIFLASCTNTSNPQMAWLKSSTNSAQLAHKSIIVSPWQPLMGCFLNEDSSIKQCNDCLINCYDSLSNSEIKAKIALEIRVKPNSYKNIECKVVTENQTEIKRFIAKDTKGNFENKKLGDYNTIRPINPKTIWILNGEENTILISGLLVKI